MYGSNDPTRGVAVQVQGIITTNELAMLNEAFSLIDLVPGKPHDSPELHIEVGTSNVLVQISNSSVGGVLYEDGILIELTYGEEVLANSTFSRHGTAFLDYASSIGDRKVQLCALRLRRPLQ